MAACTTLDPYTGEQKTSNATKGAIGGALAGAVLGALTNTSDGKQAAKNAMIGAGIGALAGGAIGNYMDQQEMLLRQELEGTGVSVTRVGDSIMLNMPGNITFATDSSDINASFYRVLNSVGIVLNKFDRTYVDVMGHTDSTGSDSYNQSLSERRASSVAQYLISQKVMPQRLIVQGYGEMRPIASNETAAGRQQNRRVEVQISPFTG
ncbi:MAG: OmpA family protein [Alphaproteobacteria bacterium]|nr:MAG: OmpA family protein [Alphaproteobacteria bacterium]